MALSQTDGRPLLAQNIVRFAITWGAALVALALLAPRLFVGPLRHWDEAWYAEVSRQMLIRHDLLTPWWNGDPFFHKPPLFFVIQAGMFALFGTQEWVARLPAFISALVLVLVITRFWLARLRPVDRSTYWLRVAFVGMLPIAMLLTIPDFARYATFGQLDVPLALFSVLALTSFWQAINRDVVSANGSLDIDTANLDQPMPSPIAWRAWLLRGIWLGLAIMTKGMAAGMIIAVEVIFSVLDGIMRGDRNRRAQVKSKQPASSDEPATFTQTPLLRRFVFVSRPYILSTMFGLMLAFPWHAYQWAKHGDEFLAPYLDRHLVQFVANINPEVDHQAGDVTFYFDYLLRRQSAWGIAFVICLIVATTIVLTRRPIMRIDMFILIATWAYPVLLALPRTKFAWYLVPMYPWAALLLARAIMLILFDRATRHAKAIDLADRPSTQESNGDAVPPISQFSRSEILTAGVVWLLVLVVACEYFLVPSHREFEYEIRRIAPRVQVHVTRKTICMSCRRGKPLTVFYRWRLSGICSGGFMCRMGCRICFR